MRAVGTVVEGSFWIKDLKDGELIEFASSSVEQVTFSVSYLLHTKLLCLTSIDYSDFRNIFLLFKNVGHDFFFLLVFFGTFCYFLEAS